MAEEDIVYGMKMLWTWTTTLFPEACTFGISTGLRDVAQWNDVLDVMQTFSEDLEDVTVPGTGQSVVLAGWSAVGFTGWHQLILRDTTAQSWGSGADLPHQLACVVGVTNLSEPGVPIGRRRNRSYIGPLNESTLEADGRMTDAALTVISTAYSNLDTALRGIDAIAPTMEGLAVTSGTAGKVYEGTTFRYGERYDVHRSRAQKTSESYHTVVIP